VFAQAVASLVMANGFRLTALSDVLQCILLLSGTLAFLPNVFSTRGRVRLFWLLMTLGLTFWLSYQLLWIYFEVYLRTDVPNPFVGDIVLFLHIVPMMAALALQPHVKQHDRAARLGALDFSLLLIFWVYLWIYNLIPWQYVQTIESAYAHNLNVLYSTEKLVFLAGLAILWNRSKGVWRPLYAHLFGANLLYAFSSYFANLAIEKNIYYSGSLYDVPLVASIAWITAAGLMAYDSKPHQESAGTTSGRGVWVARLGMMTILSLPLLAAWSVFDQSPPPRVRTFRLALTFGTMLVMGVMVFLKQHLLDRELLRLLRSSEDSYEDLQRLQAQLIQSEKLASLGQLVGGAAHELNNPLTAMLGYSDLLAATSLAPEQRTLAEKIVSQVRRTKALVASLLSFAKQVPADKNLVDVNAIVRTAMKLSQPQLSFRTIHLNADLADHLPRIAGDSNQLLQVCLHIINNAVHAMTESGGTLTLTTRRHDDSLCLDFSDTGPGIADPERVFDPFYAARPVGRGSGLGLSACYGIVREHNGNITCQNRPEGGAKFRILLPASTNNGAQLLTDRPKPGLPPGPDEPSALAARQSS
jgi:signal transduction histidine kinase